MEKKDTCPPKVEVEKGGKKVPQGSHVYFAEFNRSMEYIYKSVDVYFAGIQGSEKETD